MSQVVFTIHWNPEETGSNASEGLDLLIRELVRKTSREVELSKRAKGVKKLLSHVNVHQRLFHLRSSVIK